MKLFFEWYITTRKGRIIEERPNLNTLVWKVGKLTNMFARNLGIDVPKETKDEVVQYIKGELANSVGLTSKKYERNLATAEDVSDMLRYLWTQDPHKYRFERIRLQVAFLLALLEDSGARPGAIVLSESYHKNTDALTYKVIY